MMYRNIFFSENKISRGTGMTDVKYTGRMVTNAAKIKNFSNMYDAAVDLLITCTSCARQKYRNFIKV